MREFQARRTGKNRGVAFNSVLLVTNHMENEDSILSLIEENFQNALSSDSESSSSEVGLQEALDANPNQNVNVLEENEIIDLNGDDLYTFQDPEYQRETRSSACSASFSFCFFFLYSVGVIIATAVVISISPYGGRKCDQPLRMWNIVHASMLGGGLLIKLWCSYNLCYISQRDDGNDISLFFKIQSRWADFLQKMFNLLLFVWIIIGMVWTFSSSSCKTTSTSLYFLSFGIVIFDITIIGLILFFFLFVVLSFSCVYFFFPTFLGIAQAPPGATDKMIAELESPREYVVGMFIIFLYNFFFRSFKL